MKWACTFGWGAPATFSKSAELSCACPIFRCKKFAEASRYGCECGGHWREVMVDHATIRLRQPPAEGKTCLCFKVQMYKEVYSIKMHADSQNIYFCGCTTLLSTWKCICEVPNTPFWEKKGSNSWQFVSLKFACGICQTFLLHRTLFQSFPNPSPSPLPLLLCWSFLLCIIHPLLTAETSSEHPPSPCLAKTVWCLFCRCRHDLLSTLCTPLQWLHVSQLCFANSGTRHSASREQ